MQRKTVTILFCDVTGSTALGESVDPETLRELLARYFEQMKGIVEQHGGTVEKFIGDAVMAVFGVPIAHEDDALRAVHAAVAMRDVLPELGIEGRIGVNTGEVVTGTEERLVTGDAVNVAARLEQAASPGEILLGRMTVELVRDAVALDEVEPMILKGKADPVSAYRLLRLDEAPPRRHDARFVGRLRELAFIRDLCEGARDEPRCELLTIVADAGVGKSRLVDEALAPLDARIVRARCLPYGEGITYWPVVEILKQLDVLPRDDTAAAVIGSVRGETDVQPSAEEIAWAVRKTFEDAAAERLLVAVFDDIHWGEETFLDLVEHVALLSSGAPIVLICMARPELFERRPQWPLTLRLEPLAADAVNELIPRDIDGRLRTRIAEAAGGNPLFITEMLAIATGADDEIDVPPTLQALLSARLDRLDDAERRVLERGAVEGEVFHRGTVQVLAPEEPQVTPRLAALVRRQLIRPEAAQLPGDDGFRFRHLLIRDSAYRSLPKTVRADLHERFALWLEDRGAALVEIDEILGYHFEQAWRYRRELGLEAADVAGRAKGRLAAAGRRALIRRDYAGALRLLERARAFFPETDEIALTVDLADALFFGGRLEEGCRVLSDAAERAARNGDRTTELVARVRETDLRIDVAPEGIADALDSVVAEALPVFEKSGDDFALYVVYSAQATAAHTRGRMAAELQALERALSFARRARFGHYGGRMVSALAVTRARGPTPVPELLRWLDEQDATGMQDPYLHALHGVASAMLGSFDEARAVFALGRAELADRGAQLQYAIATGQFGVELELLAGNPAAAVEFGEEGCRLLERAHERSFLSTAEGYLAQALYELGNLDAADEHAARAAAAGASDDVLTQALSRQARAKVLARRGFHDDAERVIDEAIALAAPTDLLNVQAGCFTDLGEVLLINADARGAATALAQAFELYERKGNVVMAERVRARVEDVRAST